MISEIDDGFIARVYRTGAYVWLFGVFMVWGALGIYAVLGWTLGAAFSIGLLRGIEWFIRNAVRPGNPGAGKAMLKVSLLHWPVIAVILGFAVWLSRGSFAYIIALSAGLGLAPAIIILKVAGMLVNERLGVK